MRLPFRIGPMAGAGKAPNPGGEHLLAALGRLSCDRAEMRMLRATIAEIDGTILPCVAVLQDGTGLALVAREGKSMFRVETAGGVEHIGANDLAERYSGALLVHARAAATHRKSAPVDTTPLLRRILRLTVTSSLLPQLILAAILGNLLVFALPIYSMAVYDRIIPHRATETLWALTIGIGIGIVFMVDMFCKSMRHRIQEAIGVGMGLDLQQNLFRHVMSAELAHAPKNAGVLSSAFGAIDGLCLLAPAILAGLLVDLPFAIVILLYVAFLAHWVVLAPALAMLAILLVNIGSHVAARKAHAAAAKHMVARTGLIEEGAHSLETIKALGAERDLVDRWSRLSDELAFQSHLGRSASAASGQSVNMIFQISTVASLAIGVFMISAGDMTVGALVAAVLLTGRAIAPIGALAASVIRGFSLAQSLGYAKKLLETPSEVAGDATRRAARIKGSVRFAGASYSYPGEPRPALHDINLAIAPGEKVGIIGRIGSGKSTLIHLVPRLYRPDQGNVLIDDHDIRQYDPVWLRRHIAYMPQDCDLFDASIRDNIVRGLDTVDEDHFQEAVTIAGVKDFVANHPAGYGLVVGAHGRRLSGGERQAVCLARALVARPAILVLDEPTSAMDSQLERRVVERLKSALDGKTVLVATHRAPLLALVDRVIWLDGGRVIADGPTAEIIRRATPMSA
ncbi:MAG: hypothetical protein DI527_11150 [Chelatococcus sp.]|nr:MAG: hypothetical protein DI527_11150 [Chelatococcus sp.]